MNFIKMAVKRRVTVSMCFLCVVLLGVVSFSKIGLDLFPAMEMPMTMVMTSYEGAGSEEVEQMITKPLESALGTLQGVDTIQSISSSGSSMVIVSFNWGTDLDFAGLQMREKIDMVKGMLPDSAGNPMVLRMDPNMMPVMSIGVSGSNNLAELKQLVEDDIKPAIERQMGVASADVSGGYTQQVDVRIEPVQLELYGLTVSGLVQSIQMNNMNMAAGEIISGAEQVTIRVLGKFASISDIENVNVLLPGGTSVLLKDIATIELVNKADSFSVFQNGVEGVFISVSKQSDANTVTTANSVQSALDSLKKELPPNVEIKTFFSQADMIQMTIDSLTSSLLIGAVLAMAILFIFLRSVRSTLVIGLSIPISLIGTFVLMYFNNMTLNIMTLGGLALGVGMMVDSSIVILENIQRLRNTGMGGDDAAINGAGQLVMAVSASTLTTVAVFLPVVFVEGLTAMIFKDLALTVTFSLLASLVVAIVLVPMLSAQLLKPEGNYEGKYGDKIGSKVAKLQNGFGHWYEKLTKAYSRVLSWALDHRKRVVISITILFVSSFGLLAVIGMEFIPSSDSGQIVVSVTLQDGAAKAETMTISKKVEDIINQELGDDIEVLASLIGGDSSSFMMGGSSSNTAEINVMLVPLAEREDNTTHFAEQIRKRTQDIPGAEITVSAGDMMGSMGMGGGSGVSVTITGESLDVLGSIGEQVKTVMGTITGAREIASSLDEGLPELHLRVNQDKATALGLSVPQIAKEISSYLDGATASKYTTEKGTEIDIKVVLPEDQTTSMNNILSLPIKTARGTKVLLSDVVSVKQGTGPISIFRTDQNRQITVSCSLVDVDLNTFANQLNLALEDLVLPQGYSIDQGGSYEEMMDSFSGLTLAVFLGIILIYMVMASLFESLIQPFIIMFSMPTAFIGVFVGLFLTGSTLNVTSFIGIIMLMGIVVNNGIVLVDYVNNLRRKEGMSCREALVTAGPVRLRPILMTALTTILAMVPMGLSMGEGAELSRGMAVTVGFGLSTSTFFTLVFIPVIYSIFDDFSVKIKRNTMVRQAKIEAKLTGKTVEDVIKRLEVDRRFDYSQSGGLKPKTKKSFFKKKKGAEPSDDLQE